MVSHLVRHSGIYFAAMLLCSCGPDHLVRADKPLSLADAQRRKETDFPFPASATNIHYAVYQDWQAFEYLVRFDAPLADCLATISRALTWHERGQHGATVYQTVPLATITPLPASSWLHPVTWWDGAVVDQGFFAGEESSHKPTIWVDSTRGIFYYRATD